MMTRSGRREIAPAYANLISELSRPQYRCWSVWEFLADVEGNRGQGNTAAINVVVRVDVDVSLERSLPLAKELREHGLGGSFFFLTSPGSPYDVWSSTIPSEVADLGFEVGIHTDHYYQELMGGPSAEEAIRRDVERMSQHIGKRVRGVTFHGHQEMDELGQRNWEPYKDLPPSQFNLDYHDGPASTYGSRNECAFRPPTSWSVSDYLKVRNAWRYWLRYPVVALRRAQPGDSVHLVIHPMNAFLPEPRELDLVPRPSLVADIRHWIRIRIRYQMLLPIVERLNIGDWVR